MSRLIDADRLLSHFGKGTEEGYLKIKGFIEQVEIEPTVDIGDIEQEWYHKGIEYGMRHCVSNRDIPREPIVSEEQNIRYVTKYECPRCGREFTGYRIAKFCYECGQALDWSEI